LTTLRQQNCYIKPSMIRNPIQYYTEGIPPRCDYNPGLRGFTRYLGAIFNIWPVGLQRIMKLQPVFSLATSLVVIFLFKKGFEYVPVAIVSVIFAFFYITFRLYLSKQKTGILASFWDTALIFILNNMLLFVLPFYFESMTFPSRNILFAPIIVGLAVIAGWFELYQRLVARHPLRGSLFYALTFFCVLNFLFPILLGMRNIWSLLIAGGIADIAVIIFVYPHIDMLKNKKNTVVFLLGIVLSFALLWFGRSLIPPSPLKLTGATACINIDSYRPEGPFNRAKADETSEVYFYSSIFAPRGLAEKIHHVWYHNGRRLLTIPLSEIKGGRKEGFGTWSRRLILEGQGRYTVEIWTDGGQLLGTGNFILY
jgi:hypothetical protein